MACANRMDTGRAGDVLPLMVVVVENDTYT
jgi:hypothetical protein